MVTISIVQYHVTGACTLRAISIHLEEEATRENEKNFKLSSLQIMEKQNLERERGSRFIYVVGVQI